MGKLILFFTVVLVLSLRADEFVLKFNNESIVFELEKSPVASEFASLLPLSLDFSDYVSKEKISSLPKPLSVSKGSEKYEPRVGDFFYFAPWGNVGVFYEKQPSHSGLILLGRIKNTSYIDKIKQVQGIAKLELINLN